MHEDDSFIRTLKNRSSGTSLRSGLESLADRRSDDLPRFPIGASRSGEQIADDSQFPIDSSCIPRLIVEGCSIF